MDDNEFDKAMIAAAFAIAGRTGWAGLSVAAAATEAGLPLDRARARFPGRLAILLRFGVIADQAALADAIPVASVRDRLFDMLMRRIDMLQAHRDGVLSLLRFLPTDPGLALLFARATRRSMRWMLDAAGVSSRGLKGELRTRGLIAVWLWTVRAWRADESGDLSATMASLDQALRRAEWAEGWLHGRPRRDEPASTPEGGPDSGANDLPAAPLDAPPEPPPPPPGAV